MIKLATAPLGWIAPTFAIPELPCVAGKLVLAATLAGRIGPVRRGRYVRFDGAAPPGCAALLGEVAVALWTTAELRATTLEDPFTTS
jgi:hypothetical protein